MRRYLVESERESFRKRFPPLNHDSSSPFQHDKKGTANMSRWLAGRFAAKEALRKAVGTSIVSWKDTYVRTASDGRPEMVFYSHPESHGQIARLSISHDGEYVIATVIAPEPTLPVEPGD